MDTHNHNHLRLFKMQLKGSISRSLYKCLMFLVIFISLDSQNSSDSPSTGVWGAIASVGEPDWSLSKADLVDYFYSYEPFEPGREFRSIFPFFRQPQKQTEPQPQAEQRANPPSPRPLYGVPPQLNNKKATNPSGQSQSPSSYLPLPNPNPTQQPPTHQREGSPSLKFPTDAYPSQPMIKLLPQPQPQNPQGENQPPPPSPKYTKFSLSDKKIPDLPSNLGDNPRYSYNEAPRSAGAQPMNPSQPQPLGLVGPTYEHGSGQNPQNPQPGYLPQSTAVDSQTIVWPQNVQDNLATDMAGETQVRFLVHKPGDEDVIRTALLEDGKQRNQEVKFIEGPMLRIQRHQKVYLPPKKKTVVYILLKEPQIHTDVEVVGPTEEPVPEVFITYQKSDGVVRTKHYSPEVVKNDKYLSQLRSSAENAVAQPDTPNYTLQDNPTTTDTTAIPDASGGITGLPSYYDYLNSNSHTDDGAESAASKREESVINPDANNNKPQISNKVKRGPVHIRTARDDNNKSIKTTSNPTPAGVIMCPSPMIVNVKTPTTLTPKNASPSTKS